MSKRLSIAVMSTLLTLSAPPLEAQQNIDDRISAVESGLRGTSRSAASTSFTIEERMAHHGVPGVSIAVIHGFELEWSKGYGVRDVERGGAVDASTLFQAASISKPITAAVALALVEDGLLDLDVDVNEQLTSWAVPDNSMTRVEKVTLRRLLSHSAGLSVSGFRGYAPDEALPTILQILDGVRPSNSDPVRVIYVPGSDTRYSGGGYTVIQQLIQDITGESLADLAQRIVLQKTGMQHSSFHKPLPNELSVMTASAHTREGRPMPGHSFAAGGSGCCGLWTTAGDLALFAASIQRAGRGGTGEFLSPETVDAMLSPTTLSRFGLGLMLERHGAATYFSHSGGNPPGFSCYLVAHADDGYGAAVMTNSQNGAALYQEIVAAIARVYEWEGF